jgi:hypothetical protein
VTPVEGGGADISFADVSTTTPLERWPLFASTAQQQYMQQ